MAVGYCLCRPVQRGQNCPDPSENGRRKWTDFKTSLDDVQLNFRGNDVQDNPVVLAYLMMSADSLRLYTNAADFKEADRKTLENMV